MNLLFLLVPSLDIFSTFISLMCFSSSILFVFLIMLLVYLFFLVIPSVFLYSLVLHYVCVLLFFKFFLHMSSVYLFYFICVFILLILCSLCSFASTPNMRLSFSYASCAFILSPYASYIFLSSFCVRFPPSVLNVCLFTHFIPPYASPVFVFTFYFFFSF